jgi:hypothetical protein
MNPCDASGSEGCTVLYDYMSEQGTGRHAGPVQYVRYGTTVS